MFSIVIPLYNKKEYILQTLESVLAQTYTNYEIIIIDDGSTDGSPDLVRTLDDPRIRLIFQANAGVSAARNKGIEEARFEYIAFLDADDLWDRDYLSEIYALMLDYPNYAVYALNYTMFYPNGAHVKHRINGLDSHFASGVLNDYFFVAAQSDPIISSSSVVIQKNALNSIGGFPLEIRAGEDLLTWARLASRFEIVYSTTPKALFRKDLPNAVPRIPDTHDKVAEALRDLFKSSDKTHTVHLPHYIAYWHKIRLNLFLRLNMRSEAQQEFNLWREFAPKNTKFFLYMLLTYVPGIHTVVLKLHNLLKSKGVI